ncbi:MAG: hypothetical protein NZ828_04395 [Alphaproteobacteria bacterium]|nr:hypothetical protein [Alphaproteobacteria bacterium]
MLEALSKAIHKRKNAENIVVVTDLGRDPDDEVFFLQLIGLSRLGMANIKGVIVNQTPLSTRARLMKGMFNSFAAMDVTGHAPIFNKAVRAQISALELDNIPVAMGTDGDAGHVLRSYEFNAPYLQSVHASDLQQSGQALLKTICEKAVADNQKITLMLISAMHDADIFLYCNPDLFKAAIKDVVIMGGVEINDNNELKRDADGHVIPDLASNNRFGQHLNRDPSNMVSDAARRLYKELQLQNIPTTIVTREAAYAVQVPPEYYSSLTASAHPTALRLEAMQKYMIHALLEDVLQYKDHPRLTPEWFAATYLHDPTQDLNALLQNADDLMVQIKGFNLYDPLTAIANFFPKLFDPVALDNAQLNIIGASAAQNGIKNAEAIREILHYLPQVAFGRLPELEHGLSGYQNALSPQLDPKFNVFR